MGASGQCWEQQVVTFETQQHSAVQEGGDLQSGLWTGAMILALGEDTLIWRQGSGRHSGPPGLQTHMAAFSPTDILHQHSPRQP